MRSVFPPYLHFFSISSRILAEFILLTGVLLNYFQIATSIFPKVHFHETALASTKIIYSFLVFISREASEKTTFKLGIGIEFIGATTCRDSQFSINCHVLYLLLNFLAVT